MFVKTFSRASASLRRKLRTLFSIRTSVPDQSTSRLVYHVIPVEDNVEEKQFSKKPP